MTILHYYNIPQVYPGITKAYVNLVNLSENNNNRLPCLAFKHFGFHLAHPV